MWRWRGSGGGVEQAGIRRRSRRSSIEHGIRETRWPGRFQVIPAHDWLARDSARCGAQSSGSMGPSLCPFGALRRPSADFCFRSDARQGNLRDDRDSVSAGGAGDCHAGGESAVGVTRRNSAGRESDGNGNRDWSLKSARLCSGLAHGREPGCSDRDHGVDLSGWESDAGAGRADER